MLIASVPCSYSSDVPLPIVILGEDRLYDVGESLQYRCLPGYQPEIIKTTRCLRNGTWLPDPKSLDCTRIEG